MRKSILSFMVLAASMTGAFGVAAASDGRTMTGDEAISRLEAYINASPFGHKALTKGVSDIVAIGEGGASSVGSIYASAVAGANVELGENLYRVRVTMANVGVNKGNTGAPKLLAVDADNSDTKNDLVGVKQVEKVSNASVWRFNLAGDGKYTIACNVGQYFGALDEADANTVNFGLRNYLSDAYKFNVAYADGGEGVTFALDGKYLAMDADGKFSFVDQVTDNAKWKLSRAYDEKLDLPEFSTADNPVYYTLNNQVQGLLTINKSNNLTCSSLNEYSYWYFVDAGEGSGSFRLQNKQDNIGIAYTTANGHMKAQTGKVSDSMLFFMLEGNEANGWSINCKPYDHLTSYGYQTIHAMMYFYAWSWVMGAKPADNMDNIGLFTWNMAPAETGGEEEEYVTMKAELIKEYTDYMAYSPWCQSLLSKVISDLTNLDYNSFDNGRKAIDALKKVGDDAMAGYTAQINKEAQGYNVKISNIRRKNHANVVTLGHYLSTVGEGAELTVNTVNDLQRGPGYWYVEGVDGNDNAFRLRNHDGVYLCAASNGATVATTTDAASAGMYSFVPYEKYLRIVNADNKNAGLNVDTNGSALVGYDYKDAGSTWSFESVALISPTDGMPKVSTDTDLYLYLIRSATDADDYLEFAYDGVGLCHLPKSESSYCYFMPANDGSDGLQIVCFNHETRLCHSTNSNYPYSRDAGWNTNPYFNWYIIQNGTIPDGYEDAGKNCFAISYKYPAESNTCLSKKSRYPDHPYYMGYSSVEDWEYTGWVFEEASKINHEEIFDQRRNDMVAEVESYKRAIPWCHDLLDEMRETLVNAKMTDYAASSSEAVNALYSYFVNKRLSIEEALEFEPEGAWVSFSNVRRRGSAETGAYLTAVNGYLNTSDELLESGKWNLVYHSNGRYNLVNADGSYMCDLSDRVAVTDDKAAAGKYTLMLLSGYLCLVDRSNSENRGLNVDASNGDACVYSPADAGSMWIAALAIPAGIESVEADDAENAGVEYYNLAGVKVAPEALTPGVYLRVSGTKTAKVLVK